MKRVHVVGAAIYRDGRCLVAQRGPGMSMPGLWEFPGGKVEPGESPQSALKREIREELDLNIDVGEFLARGTAKTATVLIELEIYAASVVSGDVVLLEHADYRWITPNDFNDLHWADADIPALDAIRDWLGQAARP